MSDKRSGNITWLGSILIGIVTILAFSWLIIYFTAKKTTEYKEVNQYHYWEQPAEYQSPDQALQSALQEESQRRKESEQGFRTMQKNTETDLDQIEINRNLDKPQKSLEQFSRKQQSFDTQKSFSNKPF